MGDIFKCKQLFWTVCISFFQNSEFKGTHNQLPPWNNDADSSCFDHGIDYFGSDLNPGQFIATETAFACQENCQKTSGCHFWTWSPKFNKACWMKSGKEQVRPDPDVISGPSHCTFKKESNKPEESLQKQNLGLGFQHQNNLPKSDCFDHGLDYYGNDLNPGQYESTESAQLCQEKCQQSSGCHYWTWTPLYHNACWKKSSKGETTFDSNVISGKNPQERYIPIS